MNENSSESITGVCYALFAYDIGLAIDLEAAGALLREPGQRGKVRHPRPTPRYLDFKQPPIRVTQRADPVPLAGYATSDHIEVVLFEFGAVSVAYPIRSPLDGLVRLSEHLYDGAPLLADSRARVAALLAAIAPSVTRPRLAEFVEDYAIFHLSGLHPADAGEDADGDGADRHRHCFAQILRAEARPLSHAEVEDALASRLEYGPREQAIIDWHAAILLHGTIDDIRAVLEYANVALLEMRWLDDQLDRLLDQSYEVLSKGSSGSRWRRGFPLMPHRETRRIAQLQMDSALLFESVSNALKLVGDQYLVRLYRLAAQRMHLREWDGSILRKLDTVESIYQKLSDQAATRRLEVLEWIIIILIALSIGMMFV